MSLLSSLYTGRSGLNASTTEFSVIGDNIANANTVGFKAGRAAFAEALAQNLGGGVGGNSQMGLGTRLQAIHRIISQGAILNTGAAGDLAIEGDGYFLLSGTQGGQEGNYFTRAGQFTVDSNGYMVNLDGLRVQGYIADVHGNLSSKIGDISVGNPTSPPFATGEISILANLDANDLPPVDPETGMDLYFDLEDPEGTSNFSTGITVYDSLGRSHHVQIFFRKASEGEWEWFAVSDSDNISGGQGSNMDGTSMQVANGTMSFNDEGQLVDSTQTVDFQPEGAVSPQELNFNFGDSITDGGTGLEGITQYAGNSSIRFQSQNGYPEGQLAAVSVETDGTVIGAFTNGNTIALGQVVLGTFSSPEALERVGGSLYRQNSESGEAAIGSGNEGGRGRIIGGALEQSNVDLADEFIRMISAQRGFQANTRVISTSDQLLNELIQIKR